MRGFSRRRRSLRRVSHDAKRRESAHKRPCGARGGRVGLAPVYGPVGRVDALERFDQSGVISDGSGESLDRAKRPNRDGDL